MLSEEEKQAIDELKEEINKPLEVPEDKFDTFILYNIESAKTILNLIKKQSKEIEELKEKDDANLAYYDQIYQNGIYTGQKAVEDKIKAKIEEVKDGTFDAKIVLQSLLKKE